MISLVQTQNNTIEWHMKGKEIYYTHRPWRERCGIHTGSRNNMI